MFYYIADIVLWLICILMVWKPNEVWWFLHFREVSERSEPSNYAIWSIRVLGIIGIAALPVLFIMMLLGI